MCQAEVSKRIVPGVELFFGESVAQYIAELSDESYYEETVAEGLLLGKSFLDNEGRYTVVSGVSQSYSKLENSIGWFRCSSESDVLSPEEIRKLESLFPSNSPYVILANPQNGTLAMYRLDFGHLTKVRSIMLESM